MHAIKLGMIAACLATSVAGCSTTGTPLTTQTALINVDKTLIVADTAYSATAKIARAAVLNHTIKGDALVKLNTANDVAATALHTAYQVRTSDAVAAAVAAIADFTTQAGVK